MAATSIFETALMLTPPVLSVVNTLMQVLTQARDRHPRTRTPIDHPPSTTPGAAPAEPGAGIRCRILVVAITEFTSDPSAEDRSDR
jgi:hypothetical protein